MRTGARHATDKSRCSCVFDDNLATKCYLPAHGFRVSYVLELGSALVVFGLL
jgi:hypothetical protein